MAGENSPMHNAARNQYSPFREHRQHTRRQVHRHHNHRHWRADSSLQACIAHSLVSHSLVHESWIHVNWQQRGTATKRETGTHVGGMCARACGVLGTVHIRVGGWRGCLIEKRGEVGGKVGLTVGSTVILAQAGVAWRVQRAWRWVRWSWPRWWRWRPRGGGKTVLTDTAESLSRVQEVIVRRSRQ